MKLNFLKSLEVNCYENNDNLPTKKKLKYFSQSLMKIQFTENGQTSKLMEWKMCYSGIYIQEILFHDKRVEISLLLAPLVTATIKYRQVIR